jgi:hypothetical protein
LYSTVSRAEHTDFGTNFWNFTTGTEHFLVSDFHYFTPPPSPEKKTHTLTNKQTNSKVDGPIFQRVHYDNADRMLLASFTAELTEQPSRKVRYAITNYTEHAFKIAFSVSK